MPKAAKSAISTSQKVEAFIRNAIYRGQLKPRERLIEDDIADRLACSRGPVREAVLRLERDGLIAITPRRGTFIRDLSPDEVEVVFSIRGKLEGLCVRYMRKDFTDAKKAALMKALDAMKAAAASQDSERFLQADMRLHRTIWNLSGKQHLYRTLNTAMNPLFFIVARAYSSGLGTDEQSYKNHKSYVSMIIETPIARVERDVERYFSTLYKNLSKTVFHRPTAPVSFLGDENTDHMSLDEDHSRLKAEGEPPASPRWQ
jgi:DNA-binding GntR family transcriptional regulator